MTMLDAEFFCENIVTFRPQSEGEAAAIQTALFALGPCWPTGIPEVRNLRELVREGMTVAEGQIFVGVDERDVDAVICTARDLGVKDVAVSSTATVAVAPPKVTR